MNDNPALGLAVGLVPAIISVPLIIISIMAWWKIFTKAGRPGWHSIIPIYDIVVILQIAGLSGWLLLLFFIPVINIIIALVFALGLAKAFGKNEVFGIVALFLFSPIGILMLGFGNAKYVGKTAAKPAETKPAETTPPTPTA